jgi:hypothetical protein
MKRALFALLFAAGCFAPHYDNGRVKCDDGRCPSGYYCASNGTCWRSGSAPTLDMAHARDFAVADAGVSDMAAAAVADLAAAADLAPRMLHQGQSCTAHDICDTGNCVDGYCCDTSCAGACSACNIMGSEGTCSAVSAGVMPVGARTCNAQPATTCGADGTCDGKGACRNFASGTQCSTPSCNVATGAFTPASLCDGNGTCVAIAGYNCQPYKCQDTTQCWLGCGTDSSKCSGSNTCVNGICGTLANGRPCSADAQCTMGNCIDNYCCDSRCGGTCQACDIPMQLGACSTVPSGKPHNARSCTGGTTAPCAGSCNGVVTTTCSYPPTTQKCGSSCATTTSQTTVYCDAAGSCNPSGTTATCSGNLVCAANQCLSSCSRNSDCENSTSTVNGESVTSGYACVAGKCITPVNCAAWKAGGAASDGVFPIDPDGSAGFSPFNVYCAGMATTPLEYLELPNTSKPADVETGLTSGNLSGLSNFSSYRGGGGCSCSGDGISTFAKVRLDVSNPANLNIVASDTTFAQLGAGNACFSGSNCGQGASMPFGYAGDCRGTASNSGQAQVDLRGTPFYLGFGVYWNNYDGTFAGAAQASIAPGRQSATINGGGYCGQSVPYGPRGIIPVTLDSTLTPPAFVPALVNGGFTLGNTNGWTASGGSFLVLQDTANSFGQCTTKSGTKYCPYLVDSRGAGVSTALTGTLSQTFTMPNDAFRIWVGVGGSGSVSVALVQPGSPDTTVASCAPPSGLPATSLGECILPAAAYAGQTMKLVISDSDSASGYIVVTGFDVLRGQQATYMSTQNPSGATSFVNSPGFYNTANFGAWTISDPFASTTSIAGKTDPVYVQHANSQYEWSLNTWDISMDPPEGIVTQCVTLPAASLKPGLRFGMIGGGNGQYVRVYDSCTITSGMPAGNKVAEAVGPSSNGYVYGFDWDLSPWGGTSVLLSIEDTASCCWGWFYVKEFHTTSTLSGP